MKKLIKKEKIKQLKIRNRIRRLKNENFRLQNKNKKVIIEMDNDS